MLDSRTTLVLGRMPPGATPATHRAAGPWCFAEQEDLFPGWETDYTFAPEPLADRALQARACAEAKALCVRTLPAIADTLCPHSRNLPAAYWETLLVPWVLAVARQIVERWWRIRAIVNVWGEESLHVLLLPQDCTFSFARSQDVILHGALGHDWNHWLFSRLLESVLPPAWSTAYLPAIHRTYGSPLPLHGRPLLRAWLRALLLRLPFPPLKGMRIGQSLRYSLALLHRSRGADKATPLAAYAAAASDAAPPLPLDTLPIFLASLPRDLADLRHPMALRSNPLGPRLRVATVLAYEDAAYRQNLAIWRGRGNRLMYVQHGGNYGQVRTACDMELVEYSQHVFGTWGWTHHGTCHGNFVPVPYPQLAAEHAQAARQTCQEGNSSDLLVIGTEMAAFPYRLESLPTPLQIMRYRKDKARFFAALPASIQSHAVYRPYFSVPGTLRDGAWLQERFSWLRLAEGPLAPHLARCRLLVLDHNGTSLLEAMAVNRPVVAFWQREHWPLTEEAEALLTVLATAGIWQPTPLQAAAKVAAVWDHPMDWWMCDDVQKARKAYCARQAMLADGGPDAVWIQLLQDM